MACGGTLGKAACGAHFVLADQPQELGAALGLGIELVGNGGADQAIEQAVVGFVAGFETARQVVEFRDRRTRAARGFQRVFQAGFHGRRDRAEVVLEQIADFEISQRGGLRCRQLRLPDAGIDAVGAGHHVECERQVGRVAGQRAGHAQIRFAARTRRAGNMAAHGNHAVGRLVPVHAAPARRGTNGAGQVRAQFQRRKTGGQAGRCATGRATRGALGVPRIVGRAVDRVEGLYVLGQAWRVGLAEDHRARGAQAGHGHGIVTAAIVLELGFADDGGQAGDFVSVLDGHRHAVQRAPVLTGRDRGIGLVGALAGGFDIHGHDGVDWFTERFDTGQIVVERGTAGDVAARDGAGQFTGAELMDIGHRIVVLVVLEL